MNCYSITLESGKKIPDRVHTLSLYSENSLPGKGLSPVQLWNWLTILKSSWLPCWAYKLLNSILDILVSL